MHKFILFIPKMRFLNYLSILFITNKNRLNQMKKIKDIQNDELIITHSDHKNDGNDQRNFHINETVIDKNIFEKKKILFSLKEKCKNTMDIIKKIKMNDIENVFDCYYNKYSSNFTEAGLLNDWMITVF